MTGAKRYCGHGHACVSLVNGPCSLSATRDMWPRWKGKDQLKLLNWGEKRKKITATLSDFFRGSPLASSSSLTLFLSLPPPPPAPPPPHTHTHPHPQSLRFSSSPFWLFVHFFIVCQLVWCRLSWLWTFQWPDWVWGGGGEFIFLTLSLWMRMVSVPTRGKVDAENRRPQGVCSGFFGRASSLNFVPAPHSPPPPPPPPILSLHHPILFHPQPNILPAWGLILSHRSLGEELTFCLRED